MTQTTAGGAGVRPGRNGPSHELDAPPWLRVEMTLIGAAYWLPWHSIAAVGELLRFGARGFVHVVVITFVGRLGTAVYFTASQHYGERHAWPSALALPGALYRIALAGMLALAAAQYVRAKRAARRPAAR